MLEKQSHRNDSACIRFNLTVDYHVLFVLSGAGYVVYELVNAAFPQKKT